MADEELAREPEEIHVPELFELLQKFVNTHADSPRIVDSAILVYETVRFNDDGDMMRGIDYILLNQMSLAASRGLLEIGLDNVKYDLASMFNWDDEE